MNETHSPVHDDELHAFVDGELPPDRREAVTAWLAEHPEQAAMVAAWQAQAEAIRARYGAVAGEALPTRFNLDQLMRDSGARARRPWRTMAAAAVIAAFVVGGGAGWMARGATAAVPTTTGSITADALEAHELYVVKVRHPVEVPGNERDHMTQWLSKRLGYAQRIPDLQTLGLKLTDSFCGFKAYRVSSLPAFDVTELGYAMPLQHWVQAVAAGLKIVEFPVPLVYLEEERSFGGSLDDAERRMRYYLEVLGRELCAHDLPLPDGLGLAPCR